MAGTLSPTKTATGGPDNGCKESAKAGTLSSAEDDAGLNRGTRSTSDCPIQTSISRLVMVAVLMAGTEVTIGGCVDIGTTPVLHVTIISTEEGTGETVMETFPGHAFTRGYPRKGTSRISRPTCQ